MFDTPFQTGRLLQIKTPLKNDELLATEFFIDEAMSREFHGSLDMISSNTDIDPQKILQKPITVCISASKSGEPRYFHGLVSHFEAGHVEKNMRHYRAELRPWFWFLNHSVNCKVFQNKNAPSIIKSIFEKQAEHDYDMSQITQSSYPTRDYCFQYRESDFQFVQRLLEEEGIFYYFKHEKDKHTLILGDKNSAFKPITPKTVDFTSGSAKGNHINAWTRSHHFYPGKVTHNEYNFKSPNNSLLAHQNGEAKLTKASKYEIYHYPNDHEDLTTSKQRAQRRFEAHELSYQIHHGSSNYLPFNAGTRFNFPNPPTASEAGDYLLANVTHHATDSTYLNGPTGAQSYSNSFTAIPDTLNFRSPMRVQRPFIASAQTAIVVGPKGEEIYSDAHGRIKVQFHWDREGNKNEFSSCWIRVAQLWAGNGWGTQFIPRIGQEVVVQFLEGNPDRPIITGCVYNANNTIPYSLPFKQTQSGIKSQSTKKGGKEDYNELRFEDKIGQEEIFIQAQKDFNQTIKHDLSINIGNTGSLEATQSLTLKVAGNSILINAQGIFINGSQVKIN